jgi:hypothetical protein
MVKMYKVELRGHLRSLLNPYPRPFPRKQGKGEGQGKVPPCLRGGTTGWGRSAFQTASYHEIPTLERGQGVGQTGDLWSGQLTLWKLPEQSARDSQPTGREAQKASDKPEALRARVAGSHASRLHEKTRVCDQACSSSSSSAAGPPRFL